MRDGAAVLADQHKRRAEHHFFAILRGGASAQFLAYKNIRNILDAYRYPLPGTENDIADLVQVRYLSRQPNQVLFAAFFDIARADIEIVALQGDDHILQRQPERDQFFRIGRT